MGLNLWFKLKVFLDLLTYAQTKFWSHHNLKKESFHLDFYFYFHYSLITFYVVIIQQSLYLTSKSDFPRSESHSKPALNTLHSFVLYKIINDINVLIHTKLMLSQIMSISGMKITQLSPSDACFASGKFNFVIKGILRRSLLKC